MQTKFYPIFQNILLLLLLLPAFSGHSQIAVNLNKDSIGNLLKKMPDDTTKVLTYITLGQQYEENQPDSAIYFYRQAKSLSEKLHYTVGIIKYISNYTAVLNVQGKFDESLALNLESVRLSEKAGLKKQQLAAYNNVGAVYQHKDDKPAALKWYLKALPLLEEDGNQQNLGIFYGNLAVLYDDLHQFEKAITTAKRALDIGVKTNDLFIEGMAANNLGQVYINLNKMPEAQYYMQRTYDVGKRVPSLFYVETALLGLGTVYLRKEMPEKYIPLFAEALPLADSLDDVKGKVGAMTGIGIGYYFKRQFSKAEDWLKQAVKLSIAYDFKENLKEAYLHLSDLYIASNRLEEGERMRARYDSIGNTLMNNLLAKNVQEMETKYQVQKQHTQLLEKNLEIQKARATSSRQSMWLGISAVALILLAILSVFIYRFYHQKMKLDKQQIEAMKTEQENIRLKAIVEGQQQERQRISQEMHDDMGSGLTSILYLSHSLNKPVQEINAPQVAEKLKNTASGLIEKMNEIIWMLNDNYDSLQDLLAYMRVNLAEMVDNAGMNFEFTMPDDLPAMHLSQKRRRNIYLIVKEAVHNAIKHADAGIVKIDIQYHQQLYISVSDDGKGMDVSSSRPFSNGLRNMQERADQICGQVHFTSNNGTTLQLKIDLLAA